MTDLTTEKRREKLITRRQSVNQKLQEERKNFLQSRARKNHLEKQLENIDEELLLLDQGQLSLGDLIDGASA